MSPWLNLFFPRTASWPIHFLWTLSLPKQEAEPSHLFFYILYLICYRICGPLFQSSLVLSCCTVISTIWLIGECMYRQRNYQRPELPISCGVDDQRGDWPPAVQVHQLDSNARNRQHHAACSKSMLESTCVRALNIDNDFLLATRLAWPRCTYPENRVKVAISKGLTKGTKCRNHRRLTSRAILICFRSWMHRPESGIWSPRRPHVFIISMILL